MARLIDATALHKKLSFMQEQYRAERSNVKARMCKKIIATIGLMPEIEAEPVRHGRWIQVDETKCRCTNCDSIALIAIYPHGDKNYCPNCGAKMRTDEEES